MTKLRIDVFRILGWLSCVFALCAVASAQVGSGTITGNVLDESESAIPGATVRVTHLDRDITWNGETNEIGIFEVNYLPVGPYRAEASLDGFKTAIKTDLTLTVNQTMRVDFTLEVGDVQQRVEVRADATQALRLDTSEIGQVINHQQVADLPLNGRNFEDLIPLNAGITNGMQNASNSGYNINGSRSDNNMFLVEGVDNLNRDNNLNVRPPIDAIEEFQVLTSTFSAEYGRTAGGVITVQLKSGTNALHGSVFEFIRNGVFDANGFFENQVQPEPGQSTAPRTPLRRNQFGGTLGGPIVKNKTFFFVDYQGLRDDTGGTTILSVPTQLERQGDFSETLPEGGVLFQNALIGTPYGNNNRIPASAIDAPAVAIAAYYPEPNQQGNFIPGQGTLNNFAISGTRSTDSDQFDVKLDHQFSESDSISGHYNFYDATNFIPAAFGGGTAGPCIDCGVVLDLLAGANTPRSQNAGITEVHTFSPKTINELRLGFNRSAYFYETSDGGNNLADEAGIDNVNLDDLTTGLPWFLFAPGPSWVGTSPFTPNIGGYSTFQLTESLSHLRGKHSFKFGFDLRRRQDNGAGNFFGKGSYIMTGFWTGNSFADFMSGRAIVIQQDLTLGTRGTRIADYGFYVQDDYKVTRNLTLNLGLRYDLYPAHTEVNNRMSMLDIPNGRVLFAGVDTPPAFVRTDKNNISPRFGFAYAITANTAIRGGYGISHFNPSDQIGQAGLNPPFTRHFEHTNLSFVTFGAEFKFSDGLPIHLIPTLDNFDKANPAGSYRQVDRDARIPYTQYGSVNIQQALPGEMVLDVGYVTTKGTKLPGQIELNPSPPGDPTTTGLRRRHADTLPNVGGGTGHNMMFSSIYHSLQLKLEKRMSAGLQFLTTYTLSKSIDNKSGSSVTGGGDSNASAKPQNPFDWDSDRAISSFDRRHRFVSAINYELPWGRGKALGASWGRATDFLLGNWKVNGIVTLQSGLPFSVFAGGGHQCGCTANDMRADRIGDGRLDSDERSVEQWFDKDAFTDPPSSTADQVGRYGNAGRNIIPGPDFYNVDFSIFKEFPVREGMKFQFRAEAFNLLNRANFEYPQPDNANWEAGGRITRAFDARILQFALKFTF